MRKYRKDFCYFEGNILSPITSFDSNIGRGKKCKAIFCFSHDLPHFGLGNCFNKEDNIFIYILFQIPTLKLRQDIIDHVSAKVP